MMNIEKRLPGWSVTEFHDGGFRAYREDRAGYAVLRFESGESGRWSGQALRNACGASSDSEGPGVENALEWARFVSLMVWGAGR